MYGILAFGKGQRKAGLTEFPAESRKCGRGSACQKCRISKVKCSGTLNGTVCQRCKGRGIACYYRNDQTRRPHRDSLSLDDNDMSPESTSFGSSEQSNIASHSPSTSSSPRVYPTDWNKWQSMPDESLGLDFDLLVELHTAQQPLDLGAQTASAITPPPSVFQSFPPFQPEQSYDDGDKWAMGDVNSPIDVATLFPAGKGWTSNALEPLCTCYQATTWSLSALRGWTLGGEPGTKPGISANGATINCAKVEDFLPLFEESFAQLQSIENCPRACILSQDLAILLLLVIEQLAKLVQDFAAGFRFALDLSLDRMQGSPTVSYNEPQQEHAVPPVKIGSFEIKDNIALLMIIKTLLQIRTNSLDMYICRWGEKAKQYGLEKIEVEIQSIREGLGKIIRA
ncbi:hypothetical protein CIB48_g5647 [Xylaria polymorpha]|nr:hypothetical protein CIB48_g5647 [Xylaria polymorpha]